MLLVVGGLLLAYVLQAESSGASDLTVIPIMTTTPPPTAPTGAFGIGLVTFDPSGQYAFPIAADPYRYTWTHYHWDGINAADLEVRPGVTYPEFVQLTNVPLVAVTNGIVRNYSGNVGGQGYMLQGDDGIDYYYAHMSTQSVPDGARVTTGQPLGVMGNTGGTAQFIEPHLHLSIGPRDSLWENQPGINTAEWIKDKFSLNWEERRVAIIEPSHPHGWPVIFPSVTIVTPFDQSNTLPQPAIEFGFAQAPPDTPLDVIATLSGEVNVIRWTSQYGTRIQISNNPAQTAVVISGVDEWLVKDGDVVTQGQIIARWNPASRPHLNYMIYINSALTDPTPTLNQ